ncbi:MAG: hypothetical protein IKP86_13440 [Anaerolineaceae bacterium]|nr:hypothetical protein [Anaerolineaceae bacterium]
MKKWFENFRYYHKVHVLIILVILAAGVYYFLTTKDNVKSDYDIAVVSSRGISGEQLKRLQTLLQDAGQDQNGDNRVDAEIHVYRFAIGEDGEDRSEIARLDADLIGKMSGLFFVEDPVKFEESTNGTGKAADAVPVSGIPMLSGCGTDDLYLLVRTGADEKYAELFSALTK